MPSVSILSREDFDYSTLPAGALAVVPLVDRLDVASHGRVTIILRVHAASLSAGASVSVEAPPIGAHGEGPVRFSFVGHPMAAVTAHESCFTAPWLFESSAELGCEHLAVHLRVTQGGHCAKLTFTISVDVVLSDEQRVPPGPAYRIVLTRRARSSAGTAPNELPSDPAEGPTEG